mmetsp:Transcript_20266/g.58772  ORF Transcript_20266/g.58772 Transcript_20266/m.58772 type:complete len:517 (+) Transcript_20266:68-1618(+)
MWRAAPWLSAIWFLEAASALHVAFVVPPASPMAMMMPLMHGCMDAGHNVTVLAYDVWVSKIRAMAPRANFVSLGPLQRPELDENKSAAIWGMPYEVMPFAANVGIILGLEILGGWPLSRAALPEIQRLRPDVMCGCNAFGSFYILGEATGVPAVGVAFGPQVWLSVLEPPWSADPAIGSMHTREEIAESITLTALNTLARCVGFASRLVGTVLHNWRRWSVGLRTFQADSHASFWTHPQIIPTLPELSGGYPGASTAYSVMVGMFDHPALEGASLGKSAQHAEIMSWLDRQQELGNNVLYVAFGSEVVLDKIRRDSLIASFTHLRLNVLWALKHPPKDLSVPSHVMVVPWSPQKAVLAHPSVKAFLSHGGANSVRESVAAGTPLMIMVVMPDSGLNAVLHEKLGVAIRLTKHNITPESIGSSFRYLCSEPVQARARSVKELNDKHADLGRAVEIIENAALRKFPTEFPRGQGLSPGIIPWLTILAVVGFAIRCGLGCCRCVSRCCCGGDRQKSKRD